MKFEQRKFPLPIHYIGATIVPHLAKELQSAKGRRGIHLL
jgi:hypothetical protein